MHPLIRGLLRPEAYDHSITSFQVLETHISWVILTGTYAYKLKKPVNLGFVDFTTLDRRRHFCEEEIRLNRRLAAELYLGVRPIFGSLDQPTFVGAGTPIDFAVQMRQFDQADLLPEVLQRGELRPDHIDRLASTLAEFQCQAATADFASSFGTPDAVRAPFMANFQHLTSSALSPELQSGLRNLQHWSEAEFAARRNWFQKRHDIGRIRECHGDLHLGNMVLLDDLIQPFDCLEFNPDLRWIDVISEIAFLVMDLQERGRPDLAFRLLNRWLEQTGDYDGLKGWHWYFVYRAVVRAKVAALRLEQPELTETEIAAKRQELETYVDLASRSVRTRPRSIFVMHGLSGSGKSHIAQWLSERWGMIHVRSDAERKRLFGQWGIPKSPRLTGEMYRPEVTELLYRETLPEFASGIIAAGFSVVIDAACLKRWQRLIFRNLGRALGVPCLILDVRAEPETLRRRLIKRQAAGADPSDADLIVLERQLVECEPLGEDEPSLIINTDSAHWERRLESQLSMFHADLFNE